MGQITVSTLFSQQRRIPIVEINEGKKWAVQLEVAEARALGVNIQQAAEAALADGFIAGFLAEVVGLDDNRMAQLLNDFRGYRKSLDAWPKVVATHGD